MAQLFDNYINKNKKVPDNERIFLERQRPFKDVIVLGATNDHTFKIPYKLEEIKQFVITYTQGTEIKLQKKYVGDKFYPESEFEYNYPDGSKLYTLTEDQIIEYNLSDPEDDLDELFDPCYCVLFYHITPAESLLFNDFNKEVYVQLKAQIDINNDKQEKCITEYSRIYKIRIINSLDKEEFPEPVPPHVITGIGWTED